MAKSPATQLAKLKKQNAMLDIRMQIISEREKIAKKRLDIALGRKVGGKRRR